MKKITKFIIAFLSLAGIDVILFWVFAAQDKELAAGYSLAFAGAFAILGLGAWTIKALRERNSFC